MLLLQLSLSTWIQNKNRERRAHPVCQPLPPPAHNSVCNESFLYSPDRKNKQQQQNLVIRPEPSHMRWFNQQRKVYFSFLAWPRSISSMLQEAVKFRPNHWPCRWFVTLVFPSHVSFVPCKQPAVCMILWHYILGEHLRRRSRMLVIPFHTVNYLIGQHTFHVCSQKLSIFSPWLLRCSAATWSGEIGHHRVFGLFICFLFFLVSMTVTRWNL